MEKVVVQTMHLRGQHSRCSQYCSRVTPSSTSHMLTIWSRYFDKNSLLWWRGRDSRTTYRVCERITRLCCRHLTPRPRSVLRRRSRILENVTVDGFVDGIGDWEVQPLVHIQACNNVTTALAYALEVEAARRASCIPVMAHQLREGHPKESKSSPR